MNKKCVYAFSILVLVSFMIMFASCRSVTNEETTIKQTYRIGAISLHSNGSDSLNMVDSDSSSEQIYAQVFNRFVESQTRNINVLDLEYQGEVYSMCFDRSVKLKYKRNMYDIYDRVNDNYFSLALAYGTDRVIGVEKGLSYDDLKTMWRDYIGDEAILAAAERFMEQFLPSDTYEFHEILCDGNIVTVKFYNELDGIRVGDFSYVNMLRDGTVACGYAMPEPEIYQAVTKEIDAVVCDQAANEKLMSVYQLENSEGDTDIVRSQIVETILKDRILTLDDEGNPIVIYDYQINYSVTYADGTQADMCDYADILVELN